MEGLAQALDALLKQGILPAAFIIGVVAFFIAVIGKVPVGNGHDISFGPRVILGCSGLVFAVAGLGGALFGIVVLTGKPIPETSPITFTATQDPTSASIVSPQNTLSISLPIPQNVPAGSVFSPSKSADWGWICSGDFSVVQSSNTQLPLYDNQGKTGLIVILSLNNDVSLYARGNGYCAPYSQQTRTIVENSFSNDMLNLTVNCENGCSSVNIIELDNKGGAISNRWLQKS